MKKRTVLGLISAGVILVGIIGGSGSSHQPANIDSIQSTNDTSTIKNTTQKAIPVCDGKTITASCSLNGIEYEKYLYHPAVAQKTHTETVTTYKEEVSGYCTLCNDNTYSPTCATGRGACSWHGGVAQWNAPIKSQIPVESVKTVIDAPAMNAYIEKTKK